MKRINNILSYLWLLLLLTVVACSESDEMMDAIRGNEIVLNVNTYVPGIEASSRTAPTTENITSITALAFDGDTTLIKVTKPTLNRDTSNGEDKSLKGTMTLTVPQRTRFIHFIAKNNAEFTEITNSDLGKTARGLLVGRISKITNNSDAASISNALHYWGMLTFASAEELKQKKDVTLYRNMAKLSLHLPNGTDGHIAGILNYNTTGTMVPYIVKNGVTQFGYQTETNHALPPTFEITSDVTADKNLGTVHYLFEEYDDVGDLIYVICKVGSKYYKIALVKPEFTDISNKYYYVIRNMEYKINITGALEESLGKDDYSEAVKNGKPINDTAIEQVHLDFEPEEVTMYIGEPGTVTVSIPEGITILQIGYSMDRFDDGGIAVKKTDGTTLTKLNNPDPNPNDNIYVDTYDVDGLSELVLSMDLKVSITEAISEMEIQFKGSGDNKMINDKLIVHVLKRDALNVTPSSIEIPKTAGSKFTVKVIIPSFENYNGVYELSVNDADNKFNMTAPGNLVLQDGVYNVEKGQTYTFEFELRDDGTVNDTHIINFHLDTEYHHYDGKTTVTLIDNTVEEYDEYDIWVENGEWTGSTNAVEFFGYKSSNANNGFQTASSPDALRTEYYDEDANQHHTTPMLMSNDDSFTFTIPEGGMWLTMLVASNNTNPSINLFNNNGQPWTTSPDDANATTVKDTYNFGNGEINTDGRLIRYQLPAGTYTLQGSAAEYLLYYMRVTTDKPIMTDIAKPLITDYELAWSGGTYANTEGKGYKKISDVKHIVDQDNLTHTITFKTGDNNSLKSSLNLSTFTLSAIVLNVATTRYVFDDEDSNITSTTTVNKPYYNLQNNLQDYNAGTYSLSGTINSPEYKYKAFYDKLQLKSVEYVVKNPMMPLLYNSMNANQPSVESFYSSDPAWAIGFGMPKTMPTDVVATPINIDIPGWTKYNGEGSDTGLGVIVVDSDSYRLATQNNVDGNERTHPRPEWVYKVRWNNIAASEIKPILTDENDNLYFTYKGTIAKEVTIPTPYEGVSNSLPITLNFSYNVDGNNNLTNGTSLTNLKLNTSRVRLTATISQEDAQAFKGKTIYLKGVYSSINGANDGYAIHWVNSRQNNSTINYSSPDFNGLGLEFKIDSNNPLTTYYIEWIFKNSTNNYNGGEIGFTYTISSNDYNVIGETTATIAFTNEPTLIFNKNFEDSQIINGWGESNDTNGKNYNVSRSIGTDNNGNKYLIIENKNGGFAQAAVDAKEVDLENNYQPGNYTVSFKVKGQNNRGIIKEIVFQNTSNNYQIVSTNKTNIEYTTEWQTIVFDITINNSGDRFLIDYCDNTSVIFIDDLKLFKNN